MNRIQRRFRNVTVASLILLELLLVGSAGASAGQPNVDISRRVGEQAEATIAADPQDANVLLAASNDDAWGVAAFSSVDGGKTWLASAPLGAPSGGDCAYGDPGVAVADDGRELVSYLALPCASGTRSPVYVSSRVGPSGTWQAVRVAGTDGADNDMPSLGVDTNRASPYHGRAYVVWDRYTSRLDWLAVSHSDDGGLTWSSPETITGTRSGNGALTVGAVRVAADGAVYVSWEDGNDVIRLSRSTDGGQRFFGPVPVAATHMAYSRACDASPTGGSTAVPAQASRCIDASPSAGVTGGRVVVVYTARARGTQVGVFARSFDRVLRKGSKVVPLRPRGRLGTDQFLPVTAVDPKTNVVWACWYDTRGDPRRRTVLFTCSASRDGRTWARALPVASTRSDETRPPADALQYGDYEGLTVGADSVAHPAWTDSRDLSSAGEEIYTTAVPPSAFGYAPGFSSKKRTCVGVDPMFSPLCT